MQTLHIALETLRHDPMELIWPLIVLAGTFLIGLLVRRLVLRGLRAWTARTGSRPMTILADALRGPMLIWAVIVGAHLAIQASTLPEKVTETGSKALMVLWIVSLTIMGMRLAGNLVRNYGEQVPGALPVTTLSETLVELSVAIVGILLILSALDFRITPILTALGVGGLAVALALQDTLSNLFSGFYVAVARQIRLSDYIRLNTGEEGYVADIGWRSTTLRSLNNNMIIVPNAKLAQAIVTNFHLPEKRMSASVQVSVSYDADPDHVERVLLEVARRAVAEVPGMAPEPAPSVSFDPGFGEWSLGFTLGFQVAEFASQFGVRTELRKRILRRFREEGIVMPYPARKLYLEQSRVRESEGAHESGNT
jgi:small-conductance mechanosensitive channel